MISIAPPYWKTWWFRSLLFLSIVTFLYVLFRLRVSQILAVEELRQRIARDLHDDVGTNLSTISLASQSFAGKLSRQTGEQKTAERISIIARTTSDLIPDIVWLLKTNNDSFDDLVLKMRELAAQILSGITYTLHTPRESLTGQISLTFKRNIVLFFKECLNNVAAMRGKRHGERAADRPQLAGQGHLTGEFQALEGLRGQLRRRREDPQRDGQVETAALLRQVGGREIDGDAPMR